MKKALLISGYTRSLKDNWFTIQNHILDNNTIDIFIHITIDDDPKYRNKYISADEIQQLLKPKSMIVSRNYKLHENEDINKIFNQNYKFYLLNQDRKRIEQIENITYDIVIKIRPDVYLYEKIDFNIENDKVYIPQDSKIDNSKLSKSDDKCVCDIIAYGSSKIMDTYFNFYNALSYLIETYKTKVNETLLYNYLHDANIMYKLIHINYIVILSSCNTIAITGDSGSGKTTISNMIKNLFTDSFILECDRYHKWERGDSNWNNFTHLNPEANYIAKMTTDVFNLKIGNNIYQVDYDHKNGKFTDNELIESVDNILICGLHSLYIPDNIINLKIYIDTDDNLRIPWKIKRDMAKRGYTIDNILNQINSRKNDFNEYIYPQRELSDIIINFYTNTIFDIDSFQPESEQPVFLRIGIKETYNLSNLLKKIDMIKIKDENQFIFLYFNDTSDHNFIIKTVILSLQQNT
jgi:uridine kinase